MSVEKMVKVRIHLSAITRLELTLEKEVPESVAGDATALQDMANEAWQDSDGSDFTEDPDYFERGHCWAEEMKDNG